MQVCVWRCEHAMFCVEIITYKMSLPHSCLLCIYIYMMPVILYLLISIAYQGLVVRLVFDRA